MVVFTIRIARLAPQKSSRGYGNSIRRPETSYSLPVSPPLILERVRKPSFCFDFDHGVRKVRTLHILERVRKLSLSSCDKLQVVVRTLHILARVRKRYCSFVSFNRFRLEPPKSSRGYGNSLVRAMRETLSVRLTQSSIGYGNKWI